MQFLFIFFAFLSVLLYICTHKNVYLHGFTYTFQYMGADSHQLIPVGENNESRPLPLHFYFFDIIHVRLWNKIS